MKDVTIYEVCACRGRELLDCRPRASKNEALEEIETLKRWYPNADMIFVRQLLARGRKRLLHNLTYKRTQ